MRRRRYLVKWRGWPDEDNTWEAEDALEGCPDVLAAWRARQHAEETAAAAAAGGSGGGSGGG